MRYLFFDIEASDGNYGICEFGFVITDTNFKPLLRKIYLINPKKPFSTEGRPGRPDVKLFYPKEKYLESPIFADVYDNIKFALEQKDIKVFGHSVGNDINYLRKACDRYRLPYIKFDAFDVQKMFSYFAKERTKFASLGSVVEELVPKEEYENLAEHRSVDDAYLTMLTMKAMCNELAFTADEMIEACPGCEIISKDLIERVKTKEKDKREHPELYNKDGKRCSEAQVLWGDFYRSHLSLLDKEESIGKICGISMKLKDSVETITKTINLIKERGLVAYDKITGADFLIVLDEEDKQRILTCLKHPFNGKIVLLKDFEEGNY